MAAKIFLLLVWGWAGASLASALSVPGARFGRMVFWGMLLIHIGECVYFLPRLQAAGGSLVGHLVQTLLFGVAHVQGLPPVA